MNLLIIKIILCLGLIVSCIHTEQENSTLYTKRKFIQQYVPSVVLKNRGDFQMEVSKGTYVTALSKAKFGDLFFQYNSGEISRFFVKENRAKIYYWEKPHNILASFQAPEPSAIGLIIGQSDQFIYHTDPQSRGKEFFVFSTVYNQSKLIILKELLILSVAPLDTANSQMIVCAVHKRNTMNSLGFYKIDSSGQLLEEIKVIDLSFSPSGDPSLFNGRFYSFNQRLFFLFENRSNIFEFDKEGNFLREINTIDSFSFKHSSNKDYDSSLGGIYQEILVHDNLLYIRTNLVNRNLRRMVFDRYDLKQGTYLDSFKLSLKELDINLFSYPVWSYFDAVGQYHLLFGQQYQSGGYMEFEINL